MSNRKLQAFIPPLNAKYRVFASISLNLWCNMEVLSYSSASTIISIQLSFIYTIHSSLYAMPILGRSLILKSANSSMIERERHDNVSTSSSSWSRTKRSRAEINLERAYVCEEIRSVRSIESEHKEERDSRERMSGRFRELKGSSESCIRTRISRRRGRRVLLSFKN